MGRDITGEDRTLIIGGIHLVKLKPSKDHADEECSNYNQHSNKDDVECVVEFSLYRYAAQIVFIEFHR